MNPLKYSVSLIISGKNSLKTEIILLFLSEENDNFLYLCMAVKKNSAVKKSKTKVKKNNSPLNIDVNTVIKPDMPEFIRKKMKKAVKILNTAGLPA